MVMPMNLRSRLVPAAAGAAACLLLGCGAGKRSASFDSTAAADSMGVPPADTATIASRARADLDESSALVMSSTDPGVLFTINDSGNEPVLFAIDTAGVDRGAWRVRQATNVDWEALAVGPCRRVGATRCLYIGDVGDNEGAHGTRTIYRVPEPRARDAAYVGSLTAERLTFTYPDRRHDVEAMYVAPDGDVVLITKRPLRTLFRHLRPALVFRLPAGAWTSKRSVVAVLDDSLSVVPGSSPLRLITDASISPDASHLSVRTYSQLFIYALDRSSGRVRFSTLPAICDLTPLGEAQGEGVAWVNATGRFAFSSEGRLAPLHLANCPLPH
jgi:hypothetical protein